jgi:hypothetical protein
MIAGGNLWLHFDACFHLFDARLKAGVTAPAACNEATRANSCHYCYGYFFFFGARTMII